MLRPLLCHFRRSHYPTFCYHFGGLHIHTLSTALVDSASVGDIVADSQIEIKVGSISFSGEGNGDWLSKQLDKVLAKIPELVAIAPQLNRENDNGSSSTRNVDGGEQTGVASGTLAAYLKSTGSTTSQVRKFLATAAWLHDSEKKNRLTTKEVSTALNGHNQGKLRNPADCLFQNVHKGHCVKDGKEFYVTPDGRASLGK